MVLFKEKSIQLSLSPVPKIAKLACFSSAGIFLVFKTSVKAPQVSWCTFRPRGEMLLPDTPARARCVTASAYRRKEAQGAVPAAEAPASL